jgi:hypothetical protein
MSEIASGIAQAQAALFAACAALNLIPPGFVRLAYARWNYAPGFYYVVALAQGLTALFLTMPQTRIWGGVLGAMVLFVTIVSLLNHRKYIYAVPAILVMVALAPAMIVSGA